ncbi:MAG: 4-hydroxythreonine-4-phosphate dehydrogenase PdxA [Arenicella sp.]
MSNKSKPIIAVTLGDAGGIGSELIAKLLSRADVRESAHIVLVADRWQWEQGQEVAQMSVEMFEVDSFIGLRELTQANRHHGLPMFLDVSTLDAAKAKFADANKSCGRSVLDVLNLCMDACVSKQADAICFAPLNKEAMKLGGLKHEDELHHFAEYLGVDPGTHYFCEFNTLGHLWTSRISSHVPLKDIIQYLDSDRIKAAAKLIYTSLQANGIEQPRVAVAALNPHGGDGGTCGREEIEIITPAIDELNKEGFPIVGPFPADTIFLKARDREFDAIVTMYHDQGQIAIKLMGFERGVTVQGGLPVPITTPAHGTAYDIAGQNKANVEATYQAFKIAARMGNWYLNDKSLFS